MSGPYKDITYVETTANRINLPVRLGWFQRWFLKHSQQAWQHGNQDRTIKTSAIHGQTVTRELNTRNSVDLSLIRADGGWIVQFQTYDDNHDRHNVYHHVIPDSEDFGPRLAEIVTLQCMR